jgi:cytochrome P450
MVHEVLRMHPPLWETTRVVSLLYQLLGAHPLILILDWAAGDDIIPLRVPVRTTDNKLVDRVSTVAGQTVSFAIRTVNRSMSIWGVDAKEFKPQQWLDKGGTQGKAREIQGYRHLLTFSDGPRTCLGRGFALAEFKVRKCISCVVL